LYPTDTIWGIGCSALIEDAIERIYEIKQRDSSKPFILLVSDLKMLKRYITRIHPRIETLLDYYDRPLTIIYNEAQNLPDLAVSRHKTVGIRITRDPFCQELISRLNAPLISTSANISGEDIPAIYQDINPNVIDAVDYVVRYRQHDQRKREESIIVSYDEEGELNFIRT
jgi:L-threonylcarbamoyladenylate synthase